MKTTITPYPTDVESEALPRLEHDTTRVQLEVDKRHEHLATSAQWVDLPGTPYQIRRADCGAACKCAAEIRYRPQLRATREGQA